MYIICTSVHHMCLLTPHKTYSTGKHKPEFKYICMYVCMWICTIHLEFVSITYTYVFICTRLKCLRRQNLQLRTINISTD